MRSFISYIQYVALLGLLSFCPEIIQSSHLLVDSGDNVSAKDLVSLHAEQMGGEVLLKLHFINDSKIDSFWVERSDDGLSFRDVIRKSDLDSTSNVYRLFDKIPKIEAKESYVYYKIRMFRLEGQIEYSDIGGLMLRRPQKWQVKMKADSTNTYLQVDVSAPQKERIEVRVIDGGRKIYAIEQKELGVGNNRFQIDISKWPQQFYFVNIKTKVQFERRNFVKY